MLLRTLRCVYFFELEFPLVVCPGLGLKDHVVVLFLVFLGNSILFSMVAAPVCIPTTPIPAFVICRLLNDGYPDLVKLHLIVILICISLIISSVKHLFVCLLIICMSLWRNVYLSLLTIFWLGCFCCCCSCMGCLFTLEINPLPQRCIICKYFLPFYRLSFCFVYGFLCCAKVCKSLQVWLGHICLFLLLFL